MAACAGSDGNGQSGPERCESVEFINDATYDECKVTAVCGASKRQLECVPVTDGWKCTCVLNDKETGGTFERASCPANAGAYENAFQTHCGWSLTQS